MLALQLPDYPAGELFERCAQDEVDTIVREQLIAFRPDIEHAENDYQTAAIKQRLSNLSPMSLPRQGIEASQLRDLYGRLLRKHRGVYDKLKLAPKRGVCPLCARRLVKQLDHHLPQASFPEYSVTPANLVPVCSDCNRVKLAHVARKPQEALLHPYFDRVEGERWLFSKFAERNSVAVEFFVTPPSAFNQLLADRLIHHFKRLELAALYAAEAASELVSRRERLVEIHHVAHAKGLQEDLACEAASAKKSSVNSWRGALYESLAASNWFCTTGVTLIEGQ